MAPFIELKPISSSWFFRLLLSTPLKRFVEHRYITVGNTIYYPPSVILPLAAKVIEHEKIHVAQYQKLGLVLFALIYFVFPIPVLFTGRWFLERKAYLVNIRYGDSVDNIVNFLWRGYFYPWPKSWMKSWFVRQIKP